MSPNRRSYQDGVDDGNSNWHDRDRFQKDNDYYEGVRDGWREKERNAEQAKEDKVQAMLDRADRGYDSSSTFSSSSSSSNEGWQVMGLPLGLFLGFFGFGFLTTVPPLGVGLLILAGICLIVFITAFIN